MKIKTDWIGFITVGWQLYVSADSFKWRPIVLDRTIFYRSWYYQNSSGKNETFKKKIVVGI